MNFRILEWRGYRGNNRFLNPVNKKSFREWLNTYFVAKDKKWKTWEEVLQNADMGDFASLEQYVELSSSQRDEMMAARIKRQEQDEKEYQERLQKTSTRRLKQQIFDMEMMDFIPWGSYNKVKAELERRGVK